jgi:acyl-CoA synthetase (AMP-forming)/AMP-acid ligase II
MQSRQGPVDGQHGRTAAEAAPNLADTPRRGARTRPDSVVLECAGVTRTWSELWERSLRVASGLRATGVTPQRRVAYLGRNSLEFFEVLYGCSQIRAVPTGINWRLSAREVAAVLADTEARVVFLGADFVELWNSVAALLESEMTVIVIGRGVVTEQVGPADGLCDYESWLAHHVPEEPGIVGSHADVAMQTYTSGTTGDPKGVMHTAGAIAATMATADLLEISDSTVSLVATPIFHANATAAAINVLGAGGRCVIARDTDPSSLLRLIETHRITHTVLVPTLIRNLLEAPAFSSSDVSSLRTLIYAGSPMPARLLQRTRRALPRVRLLQVYGSTEAMGVSALSHEEHDRFSNTAGRPMPEVTVRLVEPTTGVDVTDSGGPGEVWVRSPTIMYGYWNRPRMTEAAVTPDRFVRTGDIGTLQDGYLTLVDRLNDMIISGGENVYPSEVEKVLAEHPGVAEVAIVGRPSEKWGETVTAIVVPTGSPEPSVTAQALIDFARSRLAAYKCPTDVQYVEQLPHTASGKLQRSALREPTAAGAPAPIDGEELVSGVSDG